YIHYYNNERIQVKLKGFSPVEYRTQSNFWGADHLAYCF
ncbi:TPA: IS3 family transposase, partial [Mannheimia haemolytica]